MPRLVRRAGSLILQAAAALMLLLGTAPAEAQVAPGTRFSSVVVDVGPLHARALGVYADDLRDALTAELRQAFADRLGGPGPRLVVRITGVSMSAYAGSSSGSRGNRFGGSDNDYLEGEALIVGPRGEILARHPQLSVTPSSSGGAWYDPASERRRTAYLAAHYASWLRRSL